LILDEVGVSFRSEAEKTQLFDVLDGRYREMRPTVIVSNLNAKDLQECLGPRIFDRLMEAGSTVVIFDWKSYRRTHSDAVPKTSL
jgi:DNA replication protein DnaC